VTNEAISHERCSELLRGYAEGALDARATAQVDEHLRACADCSAELRALMALRVDDVALDDLERARLRKGISDRLEAAPVGVGTAPIIAAVSPRRARLATALGVAALLAIGGVAVISLGGDHDRAQNAIGSVQDRGGANGGGAGGTDDSVAAEGAPAPHPRPRFERAAGKLSSAKLNRLGSRSRALTAFAGAYSAQDADRLKDAYVEDLAHQADGRDADLIRECARQVYANQAYAALPAYAARGRLQGRPALVLGFAWTDEQVGPLDQFMLWTWPESSCAQPIDYRAGEIGPRK
jgi:hypothetical protein